ncbi:hypothetical protein H6G54_10955 [Anabaena cylindrica FACHB-243]|uniref:Uncharacterized protein n=1 Tax=Anabaena cylindrica (strain ATCC 27899 / PCC 7122) TaxID=272123 RepID=K9ZD93_ANACC|nr:MULTISPECIES: hypothetical protein [Anabaena]AFZ56335.1 hypothetical protein Anacy_0751 [Anabaena cylindrica PCC 7122]MBD2418215.1 hypothetical protein [Anabaena cylindrica FACHB-243]MBY5283936.1 hypothetical protein [Anabaena sp. CCAP 1446/1C]MBY5311772.1 hypothetical protein [Anabaena sp. CCAP 1446/1C]MCM2409063.1 hypothetical protein [Anabaena sp. CCAP 1446/1C]
MDIYIRSRGFSQEEGYAWIPELPEIIRQNQVYELIQSEVFSLFIGRYGSQLLLLITGLDASERVDFRDRKIRNSVAWIGEDSEDNEQKIRAIAAAALRDELRETLRTEIDQAVIFDHDHGFKIAADISKLSVEEVINIRDFSANTNNKIGKNCKKLRDELAFEFEEKSLPKGIGFNNIPLVIVTGIQNQETLIRAGVWRGLSSSLRLEVWEEYKKSLNSLETPPEIQKNKSLIFIMIFIALISAFIILFLLLQPQLK